jgi:Undecaprenyl-phosphate glucose phosphotransferase
MLKKHHQLMLSVLVVLDGVATAAAGLLAYLLRFSLGVLAVTPGVPDPGVYLSLLGTAILAGLIAYRACGLYRPRRLGTVGGEFWDILKATVLMLGIIFAVVFFVLRVNQVSRGVMVLFAVLNPVLMFLSRASIRLALRRMRRRGLNLRYALIIGAGKVGQQLAEAIDRHSWTGIEVIGFLDDRVERQGKVYQGHPVLGPISCLGRVLEERTVDQVYLALPAGQKESIATAVAALARTAVDVKVVPDAPDLITLRREIASLNGIPIINLRESPLGGWGAVIKRGLDIVLSSIILVLLAPLLAAIALLIRIATGPPILFRQERMGLDGRSFVMLKFRTMAPGAEDARWTKPGDARRTFVGKWLRRFSLDEIPQLVNVIRGEMSLVGPRPERPILIEEFRRTVPRYMLRHRVRAGITGWAQVRGWRGDTSLRKRLQHDLYYIRTWSLWLDLKILVLTIFVVPWQRDAY